MKKPFLAVFATIFIAQAVWSQPQLVKDIASAPAGIFGNQTYATTEKLIEAGTYGYFPVSDHKGKELWRTDGTSEGTIRLADINKGSADSYVMGVAYAGTFVFVTQPGPGEIYSKLWKSSGTPETTQLIGNISLDDDKLDVIEVWTINNVVGILASNGPSIKLLKYTSAAGTISLVKEIANNENTSFTKSVAIGANIRAILLQTYVGFTYSAEFWTTDASAAGTNPVATYDDFVEDFVAHGDDLVFENSVRQISLLDVSSGTVTPLHDFGGVSVDRLFSYQATSTIISTREGVWATDGTAGNTVSILDDVVDLIEIFVKDGKAYFVGLEQSNSTYNFYETNGTAAGTTLLVQVRDNEATPYVAAPPQIGLVNGKLIAAVTTVATGMEIAEVSASGKQVIKDINPGLNGSDPHMFYPFNGKLYFAANDGTNGMELWSTDGTANGTQLLKNAVEGTANGVTTKDLFSLNDEVYFSAHTTGSNDDIWKTTGLGANAEQYLFANSGSVLGTLGDTIYMVTNPMFIYKGSGNGEEPEVVADLSTSIGEAIHPSSNFSLGDKFIFTLFAFGGGTPYGKELWTVNWQTPGAQLLKNIGPGLNDGLFGSAYGEEDQRILKLSETQAIFAADDGTNGIELWTTDGTPTGTVLLKDINPGSGSSDPKKINAMLNGKAYFVANDKEVWTTNGTAGATSKLIDFSSEISNIVRMNNDVYATVSDALYKITQDPAVKIHDLNGEASEMIVLDNKLYIATENSLWVSDGTSANTVSIAFEATPSKLYAFKNQVYFSANEQLWHSIGSENTTQMIADMEPLKFKHAGDLLFMTANSTTFGTELFRTEAVKFHQEISFPEITAKSEGDPDFDLNATASSGLAITYEVESGPATIVNGKAHLTGDGSVTIKASQSGDETFEPAESVSRTFTVTPVTGLEENSGDFLVYPNPAEKILYISRPAAVRVIDVNGRELVNISRTDAVDVASFTPGFYVAIINNTYHIKFIKR